MMQINVLLASALAALTLAGGASAADEKLDIGIVTFSTSDVGRS